MLFNNSSLQRRTKLSINMSRSHRHSGGHHGQRGNAQDDDYYNVLEVPRAASEDQIKKAYRRMAVKWHPDKNPSNRDFAEKKFKLVAEAYEVLADPRKRQRYDMYGKSGLENGGGSSQMHDPFDIFNAFFGGADPFAELFGNSGFGRSPFGSMGGMGMGGMGGMMNMQSFGDMGMGGSSMSMMSSSSMGGSGGMSKSVSQQTVIRDGKQITRTVTRTTQPDGTVHEDVEESVNDASAAGVCKL